MGNELEVVNGLENYAMDILKVDVLWVEYARLVD